MSRPIAVAILSGVLALTGGCGGPNAGPAPLGQTIFASHEAAVRFVRGLLEANDLPRRLGRDSLPEGDDWDEVGVYCFNGGLVVSWIPSPSPYMLAPPPLIFRADGTFLCQPHDYWIVDVTGDRVQDVVSLEDSECHQHFYMVYPLGAEPRPGTRLATVVRETPMPPELGDFDADGVYEIVITYADKSALARLTQGAKAGGKKWRFLSMVWSVRKGAPRLLFACADHSLKVGVCGFTDLLEVCVDEVLEEGNLRKYAEVKWNKARGEFDVAVLREAGVPVLVNQGLAD